MQPSEGWVTTKLAKEVLTTFTATMDKKQDKLNHVMKVGKGFEVTATHQIHELKPVDHYLLDNDVVDLVYRNWRTEMLDGTFFKMEGLLEQWFDTTVRTPEEIHKVMFDNVLKQFGEQISELNRFIPEHTPPDDESEMSNGYDQNNEDNNDHGHDDENEF